MTFVQTLVRSVTGNYAPQGNIHDADCVIGLAFGLGKTTFMQFRPGNGNEALASYYLKHCSQLPGFVQDELRTAFMESSWGNRMMPVMKRYGTIGVRVTTQTLMTAMTRDMRANGFERPALVAASHHVPRIVAIANKLGVELIIPFDLPRGFDPRSAQPWTRNALFWAVKEPLVLVEHRLRGRI